MGRTEIGNSAIKINFVGFLFYCKHATATWSILVRPTLTGLELKYFMIELIWAEIASVTPLLTLKKMIKYYYNSNNNQKYSTCAKKSKTTAIFEIFVSKR